MVEVFGVEGGTAGEAGSDDDEGIPVRDLGGVAEAHGVADVVETGGDDRPDCVGIDVPQNLGWR